MAGSADEPTTYRASSTKAGACRAAAAAAASCRGASSSCAFSVPAFAAVAVSDSAAGSGGGCRRGGFDGGGGGGGSSFAGGCGCKRLGSTTNASDVSAVFAPLPPASSHAYATCAPSCSPCSSSVTFSPLWWLSVMGGALSICTTRVPCLAAS